VEQLAPKDDGEEPRTCVVTCEIPAGATVKVGKNDAKLEGDKLTLRGMDGTKFIVSIYSGKRILAVQTVFMAKDFCVPPTVYAK